jgi:hypothetical protein
MKRQKGIRLSYGSYESVGIVMKPEGSPEFNKSALVLVT